MSTETKWTPGPWVADGSFVRRGRFRLCDVGAGETLSLVDLVERRKANATLIAAAPELYKALEALTGVVQSDSLLTYGKDTPYDKAIKGALAVLKKARGE